jgi:hypothetical protein
VDPTLGNLGTTPGLKVKKTIY